MSGYQFTNDLVEDALFRAGEPIDGSSDFQDDVVKYIDRGYQQIAGGTFEAMPDLRAPWYWLKAQNPGVIIMQPNIGLGSNNPPTAMVTRGSNNLTFSSPPVDPDGNQISVAGWYIKFLSIGPNQVSLDVFKILQHIVGDTVAILDSGYTGPTNPAAAINMFNIEYALPSDLQYIEAPLRTYQTGRERCDVVSKTNLEQMFPLTQITFGIPYMAAFIAEQKLRFSSYVGQGTYNTFTRIDFDYIVIPPTLVGTMGEEPMIPLIHRSILADYGLFQIFLAKNDDRATSIGELLKAKYTAMYKAHIDHINRDADSFGRIFPRQQDRASIRGPWRTESGYILGY